MPKSKRRARVLLLIAVVVVLLIPGGSLVYEASGGESCARCHEIRPSFEMWAGSSHRNVACKDCHGGMLTADVGFHLGNLRRLWRHTLDDVPNQVLLVHRRDVDKMTARCAECHQAEYAAWQAGPHSANFADIFLDTEHNGKRLLMDDCLRCHGMHYQGSIENLVTPVDTEGPWALRESEMAGRPTMPCLVCHEVHRHGEPREPREREARRVAAKEKIALPSLALFDRRTQVHLAATTMPVPRMLEAEREVEMSPDVRQAICYQCHAPLATAQASSGDDRTGLGVHEGISCLACHATHTQETRASCASCHPKMSNCGLDVETMDTTFQDPASKRNIHTVKCADCHPQGVPSRQTAD